MARQAVGVEEEQFSAFFRAHYNAIVRYVERRVAQPEDAAELVADVFRIAWQRFDPASAASRAWLFQVAHNVVLDHYRRSGRQRALITKLSDEVASQWRVPAPLEPENPILAALERLDEPVREVLRLRYWEELGVAEIATVLQLSPGAVRVRLHRARQQLKPLLTTGPVTRREP